MKNEILEEGNNSAINSINNPPTDIPSNLPPHIDSPQYEEEPQLPKKNTMKIAAIVSIVVAVVLVVGSVLAIIFWNSSKDIGDSIKEQETSGELEQSKTYQNSKYDFEISYPNDWTKEERKENSNIMFTNSAGENGLQVSASNSPEWKVIGLEKATELLFEGVAQSIPNSELVSSEDVTISGEPGYKAVYAGSVGPNDVGWMAIWTVAKNDIMYTFISGGKGDPESDIMNIAQEMIDSFKIKETIVEGAGGSIGWKTYQDTKDKFKIDYSSDWVKKDRTGDYSVGFLNSIGDSFQDNVVIIVQDLTIYQPMDLKKYTELSLTQVESIIPEYDFISIEDVEISRSPARKIVYMGRMSQEDLKWMQVWTLDDNKAYVITYTAKVDSYADSIDVVEKMIDSFEITE